MPYWFRQYPQKPSGIFSKIPAIFWLPVKFTHDILKKAIFQSAIARNWHFVISRIRTLYCTFQRKDLDIRVCGIRLYRSVSDGGNGNFWCGGYTDSSVLQEDQYRPGGSIRTTYYDHQRPCCSCSLLWTVWYSADRSASSGGIIIKESKTKCV